MICNDKLIDITGNWQSEKGFKPYIETREPWLTKDKAMKFTQRLRLLSGKYKLIIEYNSLLDKKSGQTIHNRYSNFKGLVINGKKESISFFQKGADKHTYLANCEFVVTEEEKDTVIQIEIFNTRPMRTYVKAEKTHGQEVSVHYLERLWLLDMINL
jgi:hypothetical protein